MTAAQARKFTFDLDLGAAPSRSVPLPSVPEHEVAAMLAAARAQGHAEGLAEGRASAQASATEALAGAAQALAHSAAIMLETLDAHRRDLLGDAAALSLAIGRRLASHLMARHPAGEVEALINDALGSIDHAPHLVIRCHPDLVDTLKSAAEARMRTSGFTGRLVVMGDPEIALGDGRLEWVDGGLVRDMGAIAAAIDEKVAAWLAAHGAPHKEIP